MLRSARRLHDIHATIKQWEKAYLPGILHDRNYWVDWDAKDPPQSSLALRAARVNKAAWPTHAVHSYGFGPVFTPPAGRPYSLWYSLKRQFMNHHVNVELHVIHLMNLAVLIWAMYCLLYFFNNNASYTWYRFVNKAWWNKWVAINRVNAGKGAARAHNSYQILCPRDVVPGRPVPRWVAN